MNQNIYKSFKSELIKEANIFDIIGKGVARGGELAWNHPKITLSLGIASLLLPQILNTLFAPTVMTTQLARSGLDEKQTDILHEMLHQQLLQNKKAEPLIPINKKIERPLV